MFLYTLQNQTFVFIVYVLHKRRVSIWNGKCSYIFTSNLAWQVVLNYWVNNSYILFRLTFRTNNEKIFVHDEDRSPTLPCTSFTWKHLTSIIAGPTDFLITDATPSTKKLGTLIRRHIVGQMEEGKTHQSI